MKRIFFILLAIVSAMLASAKTLVVYYSYTNNVHTIVTDLLTQIDADVVRIQPAEKGLDYTANNYAIGSAQISAIRNNPDNASSYPAIDPVRVNVSDYDFIIVATPLWWSNMAAPMQSFLFQYGRQMAGKSVGLIVSSASSGISSVVADARRLIPEGNFASQNLWIRSSQTSRCHSMTSAWLEAIDYQAPTSSIAPFGKTDAARIEISSKGVTVTGDFERLTLFNDKGQKVLSTTQSVTSVPMLSGVYMARLTRNGKTYSSKIVSKQ